MAELLNGLKGKVKVQTNIASLSYKTVKVLQILHTLEDCSKFVDQQRECSATDI